LAAYGRLSSSRLSHSKKVNSLVYWGGEKGGATMQYIKHISYVVAILIAMLILPQLASAHNGSRDELGGHFRGSDCVYYLHEPTSLAKSATNMPELIRLIKQYNSNADCASGLSESKVDLEGYTFPAESRSATEKYSTPSAAPKISQANEKLQLGKTYEAKLVECTDGDTAVFTINGKNYKTRFLYIDTPESTTTKEAFGAEAAQYTCSYLKQGKISLETDGRSLFDKYNRLLAWVWVGNKLHQEEITKAGFVEDFYDYGNYKYENRIWAAMDYAKDNYKGIYAGLKPVDEKKEPVEENKPSKEESDNKEDKQGEENKDNPSDKDNEEELKEENKEVEEQNADTSRKAEFEGCGFFSGIIFAILLYLILPIKNALGRRPLIAHHMWSKKWWLNVLLGILYAALCIIPLILVIIEFLLLFKVKKRIR
jgi:micrococcal nuclease